MNKSINRDLILLLAGSGCAFALIWLLFQWLIVPQITVVIERSYCQPQQWQEQVIRNYTQLYQQHPRQLKINQVVVYNDLGIEELAEIPQPSIIETLDTFGQHNRQLQQQLEAKYHPVQVLSCH